MIRRHDGNDVVQVEACRIHRILIKVFTEVIARRGNDEDALIPGFFDSVI